MYAKVVNGVVVEVGMPLSARRLDNGNWVMGIRDASVELQQACGYFLVDDSAIKPPSTATTFFRQTIEVVNGIPTIIWVETPKDADELKRDRLAAAELNYKNQARTAMATLQDIRDDTNVTNTEAVQYIKQLALINQHLIRLIVREDLLD